MALTFAQQITTAGFLGAEDYGRLAVVVSAGMLVMLITDFRTWEVGTKLLTRSETDGDTAETARVTTWLLLIELVTGVLGAIVIALAAPWMAQTFLQSPELAGLITAYAFAIPFRILSLGVLSVFPRIGNRFDWLAQKSIAYAVVRLVLMTGAAAAGLGLPGVIAGAIVGEIFNFSLLVIMALRLYSPRREGLALFDLTRPAQFDEGRRMLGQLWVSSTLTGIHYYMFVPLMSLVTNTVQVGRFRSALDIAELVERTVQPLAIVFTPRIMALSNSKDYVSLRRYALQCAGMLSAVVIPLAIGVALLGKYFIPLVLSSTGFEDVWLVTNLVLVGVATHTILQWWLRPAAVAMRTVHSQNWVMVASLVLSALGLVILTPIYGAEGAAIAKSVFQITISLGSLVLFGHYLRRELRELAVDRAASGHITSAQ
ncbi:MAG: oligosaccharide flippase family protein [Chloroflexi bacterium]|nr:oligosaccharide flippase family protein [Chloroflexota bacterium]